VATFSLFLSQPTENFLSLKVMKKNRKKEVNFDKSL
jgi:hypothetical protein